MYTYDRRAGTVKPVVSVRIEGDYAIVSVLVGTLLGAYKRHAEDTAVTRQELLSFKTRLEAISGSDVDAVDDKVTDALRNEGFEFSMDFKDRDPELARMQTERKNLDTKVLAKAFGKWLREGIVKFVEDVYKDYKAGKFRKEPCVTASFVKDLIHDIPGWHLYSGYFRNLGTRKQLQACHNALEGARKQGKLNASAGMGRGGRETRCYEPINW